MKVRSKMPVVGAKNKKIRWAKGHSSDSNPATVRFRSEARGFRLLPSSSQKGRTRQTSYSSLENPPALNTCQSDCASEKSDGTFMSNLSCTTLPSFQKLFGMWKTGSLLHKDILAVLGAVTEVIRSNGGNETEAEYLAAFLFTLNSVSIEDENVVVATVYLINLTCRHVSANLLKAKLPTTLEILYSVLCRYAETSNWALLRYLIAALGHILSVQEVTIWTQQPIVKKVLDAMLTFTTSPNPGLRKSILKSISTILTETQSAYVAETTTKFTCRKIDESGGNTKNSQATILLLDFISEITQFLPAQYLKNVFESLFKLLTVSQASVSSAVLGVFLRFFQERPSSEKLPAELNCQLILALYDFVPSINNAECVATWIFIIAEAHKCLLDRNLMLCVNQFHRCFETLFNYLLNTNELIATAAANNLQSLCADTVSNLASRISETPAIQVVLQKSLQTIEGSITLQNFSRLQVVFKIAEKFAMAMGKSLSQLSNIRSIINLVAEMRDSDGFQLKSEADECLGAFLQGIGPEIFLSIVPLDIKCEPPCVSLDIPHSWLLPLLRNYTKNARLQFFTEYFLILATRIKRSLEYFKLNNMANEYKIYSAIFLQIWDLLPSFCRAPADLFEALKTVGQIMGVALLERPELRLTILSALRTLVLECEYQPDKIKEMSRYCKNFMPILFNIYTTPLSSDPAPGYDDKGVRLAVLETVRVLLKITPSQLLDEYLAVALTKVENELTPLAEKSFVLDLCVAFTKYLTEKQIERLYQKVAEFFTSEITTSLQKKSFRVLEEICCSETDGCVGYVATHLDDLKELLTADLRVASPAAKGCRLQSIFGLLKVLGEKDVNFVKSTVPAITFCLKENNSKTRKRAAVVLVGIIKFLKDHVGGVNSAVMTLLNELDSYVTGSSGQETAACLIATRLILYEFRLELSSDTLSRMIHLAMEKTTEEQRPVVQSAIEFLSTAVGCCSDVTVRMYLGEILGCLFQQTSDCQNHFRFLTRKVLIKLAKKFGAEVLTKFIPEAYQKQLAYVRKFCQRQEHKRQSQRQRESIDSDAEDQMSVVTHATTVRTGRSRPDTVADLLRDSSEEDESDEDKPMKKATRKANLWLKEGDGGEDIVDLLDRSKLAGKIDSVDPKLVAARAERQKKQMDGGFKMSKDGRIIIGDLENNGGERIEDLEESDDESIMDCTKPKGKRKRSEVIDGRFDASYQPGGSGLHRKLDGKEASSRKRKGDTDGPGQNKKRRSGKEEHVQPYTYIPMEAAALNRRKRAKFQGRFNNLVRGARKGANKGKKQKRK